MFVPGGGLANRMLALAAAHELARRTGVKVEAMWFKGWGMGAAFSEVFLPINTHLFTVKDGTLWDELRYDRPRRHNLWLPALPQRLMFRRRIDEAQVADLRDAGFDFDTWALGTSSCHLSSCCSFGTYPDDVYAALFRPVPAIVQNVNEYKKNTSGCFHESRRRAYSTHRPHGIHSLQPNETLSQRRS